MVDVVFQFLFKYRPLVFQQGDFVLDVSGRMVLAILIAVAVGTYALLSYRGAVKTRSRDRVVLMALRLTVLAIILFCLFRPTLILTRRRSRSIRAVAPSLLAIVQALPRAIIRTCAAWLPSLLQPRSA